MRSEFFPATTVGFFGVENYSALARSCTTAEFVGMPDLGARLSFGYEFYEISSHVVIFWCTGGGGGSDHICHWNSTDRNGLGVFAAMYYLIALQTQKYVILTPPQPHWTPLFKISMRSSCNMECTRYGDFWIRMTFSEPLSIISPWSTMYNNIPFCIDMNTWWFLI